jgi:menaquinone-dependent protoporphyrinogen oxidase
MTRILILYGTTDGHTAKIARRLSDTLRSRGADTDVVNLAHARPRPAGYDGVIVAASVHTGTYQPEVRQWVRTHAQPLAAVPSAFLSVCLGVLQHEPEVQEEVAATIRRFLTSVGWEPTTTKAVAGALLYTQYGWLKRWVMRRIVRKAGGDIDTTRDYEYTDWADLDRFSESFAALVAGRAGEATAPQYAASA